VDAILKVSPVGVVPRMLCGTKCCTADPGP
jgi:hypothetical protein